MLYLSQLLNAAVEDASGERFGKVADLVVSLDVNHADVESPVYPRAVLIDGDADQFLRAPFSAIEWRDHTFHLRVPREVLTLQPEDWDTSEVLLERDLLDKQVIDLGHKKAVRVNDICLGDDLALLGIDHSTMGLARRLAPSWILGASASRPPHNLVPWHQVELIGSPRVEDKLEPDLPTRPVVHTASSHLPGGNLANLHPADLADILHQLTPGQGAHLLESLDDESAADTLEEIETERQAQILDKLEARRAAGILDKMGPDEAADVLAEMDQERSRELLTLMNPAESEDVQGLLEYDEDTAGGLMTTSFVELEPHQTVAEALEAIRITVQSEDIRASYVYCVEGEACLLRGSVSLWDLLVARPEQPLREIMEAKPISVQPEVEAAEVAELIAKYNLLAVPVVDAVGGLQGVITIDDAIDVLLPNRRKRKQTRMY